MAITYIAGAVDQLYMQGLSTDTKPAPQSGYVFFETDTGKTVTVKNGAWSCATDLQYQTSSGVTGVSNQVYLSSGVTSFGGYGIVDLRRHVDGVLHPSKMGTGSGGSTKFLREDNTWQTVSAGAAWGSITGTLSAQTDLQSALDGKQASDSDLTTIAGLTATTNNFMIAVASAWASATPTTATSLLNVFTSVLQGLVPASGGGTANFLRADGTWTAPTAAAAAYNPNIYITTADQSITANYSIVFASEYQIGNGFLTTLNSGSILQIT